MIKLSNINKYYFKNKPNEIHVLNNISLELDDKGFVTILGPSGSGKSTLLNVIGKLDNAKGDICYEGLDLNKISNFKTDEYRNKNIGYIFQNYNLIHEVSVYDNLKIQLDLVGITDPIEVENRINNSLKVVGMDKYKRRIVTALSGGQQQRVAIARALVKGSKVIIADEPTGNLDSKNSIEVMNLLKKLSKRCLIVLVTHNPEYANHYADRIIRLKDGVVIEDIKNNNSDSLLDSNFSNSLYLDQFNKNSQGDITIFSKDNKKINLRIVYDGVNIYIENNTDAIIKVIGEDTDKVLIEKTPESNELELTNKTEVDFSVIDSSRSFKQRLIKGIEKIKNGFLNFFFAKKKSLMLNLGFFLIGFILCVCACFLSYTTYVEESILVNDPVEAARVFPSELGNNPVYGPTFSLKELKEIITAEDSITGLVEKHDRPSFKYTFMGQRQIIMDMKDNCYLVNQDMLDLNFDLKGNEIVISDVVADLMVTYLKNMGVESYNDLIGLEFDATFSKALNNKVIIKDIVKLGNKTFIVSDYLFYSYRSVSEDDNIKYSFINPDTVMENLETNSIRIDGGSEPIYVSRNLSQVFYDNLFYDVLGYFDSNEFEVIFPTEQGYLKHLKQLQHIAARVLPYDGTEIIIGEVPIGKYDIVLPSILNQLYNVGDTYLISGYEFKITGFFDVEDYSIQNAYTSKEIAYLLRLEFMFASGDGELKESVDFYTTNFERTRQYFESCGYNSYFVKDYVLEDAVISKRQASQLAIIVSSVVIIVMILFIFFISRSRMLKSVYTIGVYRALGSNKSKIIGKYIIDGFVMATCTAVLGFVVMYSFSLFGSQYLPGLTFDFKYFLLIILGIYIVMIGAFILPVYLLLRKTPIEILVKYDI